MASKKEITELIQRRRRQILLHSYIYYELNDNLISDDTYTKWAFELDELQKQYPDIARKAPLFREFCDFDPCTGHGLNYKQPWIVSLAKQLLRYNGRSI